MGGPQDQIRGCIDEHFRGKNNCGLPTMGSPKIGVAVAAASNFEAANRPGPLRMGGGPTPAQRFGWRGRLFVRLQFRWSGRGDILPAKHQEVTPYTIHRHHHSGWKPRPHRTRSYFQSVGPAGASAHNF